MAAAIDISLVMLCCSLSVQLAKSCLLDLERSFEYLGDISMSQFIGVISPFINSLIIIF